MSNNNALLQNIVKTLQLEGDAILKVAKELQSPDSPQSAAWSKAISIFNNALDKGGKIIVTGVGKSGKIAQKISATLSSTGSYSIFLHPTEGLHGDIGFLKSGDAVLALSHTGNTEELLKILPAFKERKVSIIALTGNIKSQLAEQADAVLLATVEQEACPHNLAPTTSTTLALAMGDAIAMSLMKLRNFDPESFAKNHPGGSIGKKLNMSVADCMHSGDSVGLVGPDTTMDQVVVISTQKRLGAVLVVQGKKLLGIITDGDIRRALNHRERFFKLQAKEVMTQNPVQAIPDMRARDALALMENRPSQINVLPVVNTQGDWVGILRLHDLVKSF